MRADFGTCGGARARLSLAAGLALALAGPGCALTAGGARGAPSGAAVALVCAGGAGAGSLAGEWRSGVLVLDLTALAGNGECSLSPPASGGWPERLALRVLPGVTPALEIDADQRLRLPAAAAVGGATELVLPHSLHSPATVAIRLRWGTAAGVAVATPP